MKRASIWWGLALLWCGFIYHFTASSVYTGQNTAAVVQRVVPKSFSKRMVEQVNKAVRKSAHVFLFAGLGALCYMALRTWPSPWLTPVYAWLMATIYAVTDEYHQTFVPGRSGLVKDVLLDSAGALAAVLLLPMIMRLVAARRNP